ncbi:MAG TPA: xanthine dehydrogenase family protein subunit M [Burkholderiales bacterium]|nr:xanthine dehydrogenase family protein subunit M [Burkholderiales bacterium]
MIPFELVEPRSLAEAIALLDPEDTAVRPMSGGTAIMLMMKAGVLRPTRLVSLARLELDGIEQGPEGELRIGALTRLADIERSALVRRGWPVIARALRTLSNVRVRNVARLGGHLAHGDPHTDLPPLLSALGARVAVAGARGERVLSVEALYAGYLETTLKKDELITAVEIPALAGRAAYLKCTTRSADDWPALGVAVAFDYGGEAIGSPRLFISAATDRPTRLAAAEKVLAGRPLNEETLREAGAAAAGEAEIESDLHGSAAYKKQLIRVYVKRAIHEALRESR